MLIRPGLLADVEIILEKIPNAIHVPAQAVFEKDGKQIVWVKNGRRWDEREVKPLKRTESTMIIASGLKPGETVALSDPNAKPGDKKKEKGGATRHSDGHAGGGRSGQIAMSILSNYLPELQMGLASLFVHKLRSVLTMLGMIFGVGAVVAMLSITSGAQKEMMSYIDLLGVNNIIIEAKEAVDRNELQARRAISPGLTFRDYRAILENVPGIDSATPAQALQAPEAAAEDLAGAARAGRRHARLPEDQQPQGWWRAGSSTRRTTRVPRPSACWANRPR